MPYKYKDIPPAMIEAVEAEVKMLLHGSRDCLRNRGDDTTKISFRVTDGYYAEAFGVMRGLALAGYGYMGGSTYDGIADCKHGRQQQHNLRWWFDKLVDKVLEEENFHGSNECDYCLDKHFKDGAGRKR